jgi:hypothetical protein
MDRNVSEPIERCKNCRFWQPLQVDHGICRRNSPVPRDQELGEDGRSVVYRVSWPETYVADWCGEFESPPESAPVASHRSKRSSRE